MIQILIQFCIGSTGRTGSVESILATGVLVNLNSRSRCRVSSESYCVGSCRSSILSDSPLTNLCHTEVSRCLIQYVIHA
jgi:hypothetical protein